MAFSQTLRDFQRIMLAISIIWLCLFFKNVSILTKTLILRHPPSRFSEVQGWEMACPAPRRIDGQQFRAEL